MNTIKPKVLTKDFHFTRKDIVKGSCYACKHLNPDYVWPRCSKHESSVLGVRACRENMFVKKCKSFEFSDKYGEE